MSRAPLLFAMLVVGALAPTLPAQQGHGTHASPMYHFPRFSPDGRTIVTTVMSASGVQVQLLPAAGGSAVHVPLTGLAPEVADWTASGELMILVRDANNIRRGFVVDRRGGHRRAVPVDSIGTATSDSGQLVFESAGGGGNNLYTMDRTRRNARQLTRGFWAEQPAFSPDGSRLVFEKRVDPNDMLGSEIVLMKPDGSEQVTIARGTDPSWSGDGRRILFKTPDQAGTLWIAVVDPVTRVVRRLARGVHPHWSPDGRLIAFMRDESDGRTEVYVVGADGSGERCLTCRSR